MTDPIPIQRESAYDQLCAHIERLNDRRRAEHHKIRLLHHDRGDGHCAQDGHPLECPTLQVIDAEAHT